MIYNVGFCIYFKYACVYCTAEASEILRPTLTSPQPPTATEVAVPQQPETPPVPPQPLGDPIPPHPPTTTVVPPTPQPTTYPEAPFQVGDRVRSHRKGNGERYGLTTFLGIILSVQRHGRARRRRLWSFKIHFDDGKSELVDLVDRQTDVQNIKL